MKTRFKNEKHAREETIGRAGTMARVAIAENREFNDREQRKVEAFLLTAESLGLGKNIPRIAAKLIAWVGGPKPLAALPKAKKPARVDDAEGGRKQVPIVV